MNARGNYLERLSFEEQVQNEAFHLYAHESAAWSLSGLPRGKKEELWDWLRAKVDVLRRYHWTLGSFDNLVKQEAYYLWQLRMENGTPGTAENDWLEAESIVGGNVVNPQKYVLFRNTR